MQKHPEKHNFYGKKGDGYFIDIGIPEDYHRAKEYFFG
jgi:NDP-sugar pyrophosphorylase family protein